MAISEMNNSNETTIEITVMAVSEMNNSWDNPRINSDGHFWNLWIIHETTIELTVMVISEMNNSWDYHRIKQCCPFLKWIINETTLELTVMVISEMNNSESFMNHSWELLKPLLIMLWNEHIRKQNWN